MLEIQVSCLAAILQQPWEAQVVFFFLSFLTNIWMNVAEILNGFIVYVIDYSCILCHQHQIQTIK